MVSSTMVGSNYPTLHERSNAMGNLNGIFLFHLTIRQGHMSRLSSTQRIHSTRLYGWYFLLKPTVE